MRAELGLPYRASMAQGSTTSPERSQQVPDGTSLTNIAALSLVDACTAAAAACFPWVGRGDKIAADHAAVEAMRAALAHLPGGGIVVIGEGEKDDAPMLFEGEIVGDEAEPLFDLAIDPLEGTNLCASGGPGAITVISAAPRGRLRALAGFYMDKIVVGAGAKGHVDIDAPVEDNIASVAAALDKPVERLRVIVMRKPRHVELIERIRASGASVHEITDGDVMAGLGALVPDGGVDLAVGIGGAPEAVITACAVRLLGGDMQGRMAPQSDEERARVEAAGEADCRFDVNDLVDSDDALFAATAVTASPALKGPQRVDDGLALHTLLVTRDHGLLRLSSTVAAPP